MMFRLVLEKYRSYQRFLRLSAFDQSTEQGIRDERYRRAFLTSAAMLINRGFSLIAGLFTVYIAISGLGAERFGALNTLIMLLSVIGILNLGIPSAFVNRIAQASAEDDAALPLCIATNLLILFIVAICASLFCFILFYFMPWQIMLKSGDQSLITEAKWTSLAVVPIFFLQIIHSGLSNIFLGLQRGFLTNAIAVLVSILTLGTVILAMHYASNLAGFLWATQGVSALSSLALLFYIVRIYTFDWARAWQAFSSEFRKTWAFGRSFLSINILIVLSSNLDVFLASTLLSPKALSELVTVQRLFQVFLGFGAVMFLPLWASYADAVARRDYHFVRLTLIRSMYASLIFVSFAFPITIYFYADIFSIWTNGKIIPDTRLVILVGFSAASTIFIEAFNIYLNGCGILRPQIKANILFAFLAFTLKSVFAFGYGIEGIVIAGIIAYNGAYLLCYLIFYRRICFEPLRLWNASRGNSD